MIFILAFFCPIHGNAANLEKQRAQFLKAEAALNQGNVEKFNQLKVKLTHYPLYPYLEYQYLMNNLDLEHMPQIQNFLKNYSSMSLATELRQALIYQLVSDQNWQGVIQNYQSTKKIADLCHYLYAHHSVGNFNFSNSHLNKLWLVGRSQPNECDPIFARWVHQGLITDKLIWRRLNLVMQRSDQRLSQYLVDLLSAKLKPAGKLYLRVNKNPILLLKEKSQFIEQTNQHKRDIIANGLSKLAAKEPAMTLPVWEEYANVYSFTLDQENLIIEKMAKGFMVKKPTELKKLLALMKPNNQNKLAIEFLVRYAISLGDWELVRESIEKLPPTTKSLAIWQYWQARSLEHLGKKTAAKTIFSNLAKYRNYYGFLSATRLNKPFPIHDVKIRIEKEDYETLSKASVIDRIHELMLLERDQIAYNEWIYYISTLSEKQKYIAAQIAHDNFWPYLALKTAIRIKHQDDLQLRFPMMFKTFVKAAEQRYHLDVALIYAMIRQESYFQTTAKSYVGARGLMQLMPGTANDMARKVGIQPLQLHELYYPKTNIRLGTAYIRMLLDMFDKNIILTIAAYNAGPGRVEQWLPEHQMPADMWIETIPFHETREYVKSVTSYMLIYQYLLGKPPSFKQIFKPIKE